MVFKHGYLSLVFTIKHKLHSNLSPKSFIYRSKLKNKLLTWTSPNHSTDTRNKKYSDYLTCLYFLNITPQYLLVRQWLPGTTWAPEKQRTSVFWYSQDFMPWVYPTFSYQQKIVSRYGHIRNCWWPEILIPQQNTKIPWTIEHVKCKGNSRMPANFKIVGRNVFYIYKDIQRGVKILVHPGLNFLGEWEHPQGTPWRNKNCFIHAGACPLALTAFSLARLRACDMLAVQLLSDVGLMLVPVHLVRASCIGLFVNKGQVIPMCQLTQGQSPSFYIKETLVNGSRLRVNLCFGWVFLILGQPCEML